MKNVLSFGYIHISKLTFSLQSGTKQGDTMLPQIFNCLCYGIRKAPYMQDRLKPICTHFF